MIVAGIIIASVFFGLGTRLTIDKFWETLRRIVREEIRAAETSLSPKEGK